MNDYEDALITALDQVDANELPEDQLPDLMFAQACQLALEAVASGMRPVPFYA